MIIAYHAIFTTFDHVNILIGVALACVMGASAPPRIEADGLTIEARRQDQGIWQFRSFVISGHQNEGDAAGGKIQEDFIPQVHDRFRELAAEHAV